MLTPGGTPLLEGGKPVMEFQDRPIHDSGPFIRSVVVFLFVAVALFLVMLFLVISLINTAKARFEETKTEAAAPPEDVVLLREIRDALIRR